MNLTEKDKGLHVYFGDIHHGKDARSIYLYACLYECETGNLIISADMDYCLEAIKNSGWIVEKAEKVKQTTKPASFPSDQDEIPKPEEWITDAGIARLLAMDLLPTMLAAVQELQEWRKYGAALPVGQKKTFERWWSYCPRGGSMYSSYRKFAETVWNAAKGSTN